MSEPVTTTHMYPEHVELNATQQEALDAMRSTFDNADGHGMAMNDSTFLRYLRARNYHLEKAKAMLDNTLKWRESFGLKDLHTGGWKDTIEKENCTGKSYLRGFDKHGHVLMYMKPVFENTNDHDGNIKHLVYTMERAVACAEKRGTERMSLIIDYDGFSLMNAPPMKTSRETLTILQDHYPERLFRAYCIRPPYVFYGFYKVITPFIDPVTKNKICMLTNADMAKETNHLYHDADKTILESSVGGGDSRPFDSKKYLTSVFDKEYLATLNEA
jgi:hypothetical protein